MSSGVFVDMMNTELRCVKCGSSSLIPDARIADRTGHGFATFDLEVTVNRNPEGLLKGAVRSPLRANVCGSCGFVELNVEDAAKLWEAHREALQRTEAGQG